ncbi:hypothetical protein MAC_00225 [Metarhizium acridum CQMa 102]|uniref:Uncharacterized protein n=1 Tax=Metarhizium acridum (strain CQMa 102) TaxID=655827 RepID=E9DR56_METAQ|nr:uncharacterized protein MAC_00225 [Metarhizium acridum CQMa 102]EFY93734.1 hypothetical protein MAC_00225 [Metarhizium acridum CQMa 102]
MTRLCNSFKRILSKARCRPKRRRPKVPQDILLRHKSFELDSPQLTQKSPKSDDKTLDIEDTSPVPILPKSAPSLPHAVKAEVSGRNDFEWEVLWYRAYEIVKQQQPDLIVDFEKHLATSTGIEIPPLVEKDLLSSPESAQKIVEQLQTDRAEKQWRVKVMGNNVSVLEQVEKLGRFLLWSDEIVKSALSAQPYASMAWSGVSMLVPLLSVGTVQHEAMLEGFGSICDIQMYWWSYKEKIAKSSSTGNDTGLAEALPKLFSLVFEYQARVICHLVKNQLSRAWEKAVGSRDWASLQSLALASHGTCKEYVTRGHNEEVETHMTLQSEKMERSCQTGEKILQTLQQGQREEWERELLNNLASAAPTYERDKNFNPDRVEGTCEWFFRDSTFCNWRDNQSSSLIWISAGPGCGKSVLSRALIDEGHLDARGVVEITDSSVNYRQSPSNICYFFFKDQDALRTNTTNALCAMLHQLFCGVSNKSLIRYAESSHRNYNTHLTTNLSELWRILIACAESPELNGLVCVLDAMDECSKESREELFLYLRRFYNKKRDLKSSKIKFLLTGRPYDHLKSGLQLLENNAAYIHYDGDDRFEEIGRDIDLVIDAKVDSLGQYIKNENDRDRIRQRLKKMDNRTYLWLHLTWNIITEHPSKYGRVSDIEPLLSDIPPAVEDAYEKILNRSTDIKRTEALLQLVLAAKRPLTIEEANYALTLTTTSTITKDERLTHKVLSENIWSGDFKFVVKNLCGLFVNVYDSKLYFIHQTAREFLTGPATSSTGWMGRFDIKMAHTYISRCCLRYLLLPDMPTLRENVTSPRGSEELYHFSKYAEELYPFSKYAEGYVLFHFDSQADDAKEKGFKDIEVLFHSTPRCSAECLLLYILGTAFLPVDRTDNIECNKLLLASYFGLPQVVRRILEAGNQTKNISSTAKVAALQLASKKGHLEVVKVLLLHTNSADVKTEDYDATALHAAASGGHLDIVRLLLLNGANTEIPNHGVTPLSAAADSGHKKVIDMLLSHKANARNYSGFYETPLSKAAEQGRDDIVEVLLPVTCVGALSLAFFSVALQWALVLHGKLLDRLLSFLEILEPNEGYHQTLVLWAARYATAENMAHLLQKWRNRFLVTEKLLVAATRNKYHGPRIVTMLLDECGSNELI